MSVDQTAGTFVVNGQRFNGPTTLAYNPMGFGPQTTGVPNITPSLPPFIGGASGPLGAGGVAETVNGYGTAGNNAFATQLAAQNPWNWRVSPVIWAIVGLLLSIFLLRHVHWRDTILETHAGGHAGPVGGEAHAEVD